MIIGIDYWNVFSSYPNFFKELSLNMLNGLGETLDFPLIGKVRATGVNEVHIISAIGPKRIGTIEQELIDLTGGVYWTAVHEVVFRHPRESPTLKLAKCQELGVTAFFDDREDVCSLLTASGILAFRVPRLYDIADIESDMR